MRQNMGPVYKFAVWEIDACKGQRGILQSPALRTDIKEHCLKKLGGGG
jgi:hypothetical protein